MERKRRPASFRSSQSAGPATALPGLRNTSTATSQEQPFAPDPVPYFRLDPWLKNGSRQLGSVSVSGGGDALKYFASGSRENSTGVLPNESLGRTGVRGNFSFTPVHGLELNWNTALMHSNISNASAGVNPSSFVYNVMRLGDELRCRHQQRGDLQSPRPAVHQRHRSYHYGDERHVRARCPTGRIGSPSATTARKIF